MRRGRQNYELKYLAAKIYHTSANLTFGRDGKKYLGVQKAQRGAKKAYGDLFFFSFFFADSQIFNN